MADDADCVYCSDNEAVRAWAPRGPAVLSVIGSVVVMRELWASDPGLIMPWHDKGTGKIIPRILFAMSISDIFFSLPYVFTTWLAPSKIDLYQSFGTVCTCTLQGASLQFGVSTSPLFSTALSLCALLMVRYNWNAQQLSKLEIFLFPTIYIYGLLATIPFIPMQMYNPTTTTCWLTSYPRGCVGDDECERGGGQLAEFFWTFFAFFPTWPCLILVFIFLLLIHLAVRRRENRLSRYMGSSILVSRVSRADVVVATTTMTDQPTTKNHRQHEEIPETATTTSNDISEKRTARTSHHALSSVRDPLQVRQVTNRTRSRAVAVQITLYTIFFMLTFSMDTILILFHQMGWRTYDWMNVFAYMLFPMQGFFNFIIFARPRTQLKTREGRVLRSLFFGACLRNCYANIRSKMHEFKETPEGTESPTDHVATAPPREIVTQEAMGVESDNYDVAV